VKHIKGSKASNSHAVEDKWLDMEGEERDMLESMCSGVNLSSLKSNVAIGTEAACKHMKEFLDNNQYPIPPRYCWLMKFVPDFTQECAYKSHALVEHIFTNIGGKNYCIFHSMKTARIHVQDNTTIVTGVPYPRTSTEANSKKNVLCCGCYKDEAFLDFMFYKLSRAHSWNEKLDRVDMLHKDPLELRHCTFIVQAFFKTTGLTLGDLYENENPVGDAPQVFGLRVHMLTLMAKVLGQLNQGLPVDDMVVLMRMSEVVAAEMADSVV
jgi:hypothetical protein